MYALEKNNNQAADCSNTQCPRVELDKEDRNPIRLPHYQTYIIRQNQQEL